MGLVCGWVGEQEIEAAVEFGGGVVGRKGRVPAHAGGKPHQRSGKTLPDQSGCYVSSSSARRRGTPASFESKARAEQVGNWQLNAYADVTCPRGPAEESVSVDDVSANLLRDRVQRMQYPYREFACSLVVKR